MDTQIEMLKESNEFLNLLLENITSVVFIVDKDMRIRRFNSTFSEVFADTGREVANVLCGNALGCANAVLENKQCGETKHCEVCKLRQGAIAGYHHDFVTKRDNMDGEFFVNGEKIHKYLQYTIRPLQFSGEKMVMLVIGDTTALEEQKNELACEIRRADELLLNVLPIKVADELKTSGESKPRHFGNVSILFSDFANFTYTSTKLSPEQLIDELNDIFTAYDDIVGRHYTERIKTIGDAYLAVCGMPLANPRHAEHIVNAAKEMLAFLEERNRTAANQWHARIGIHSGPVVGGIVGVRKYIYDVFGDAVNTASRMETSGEPMRINVSDATYQLLKDKFSFVARAPIKVKGKGLMQMHFLDE